MRSPLSSIQLCAIAASVTLGLELAVGCHHADGLDRTAPLLPVPLAWSLSEGDAFARLQRAGMAPRSDEVHAYFTTPDQFHAAPGTIEVAHTVEPMIRFTPRVGWTAIAHYRTVGGPLDRVELTAQLPAAAARTELVALERRYGPPDDRYTYPGDAHTAPGSTRLVWVRGGIWLVAVADPNGVISIAYRRDDHPASAITR